MTILHSNLGAKKTASFYTRDADGNTIVASTTLKHHKAFDIFYRPKTSDSKMIRESAGDYATLNCFGKVVMDCGANIGGFIKKACADGAKKVVSFEPEPFNFEVLEENRRHLQLKYPEVDIEVKNSALCNNAETELLFNMNASSNSACSGSLVKTHRSFQVKVNACNFWDQLEQIRPQILKIDIEGAEYSLIEREFPDFVEEVAFELHGFKLELREKMFAYIKSIEENPKYQVISKQIIMVFNEPKIALLHFRRVS